MRRGLLALHATLLACAPPVLQVELELEPTDAVVLVLGDAELATATTRVVFADGRGAASLEAQGSLLAAVPIRARDVSAIDGAALPLAGLSADLEGDLAEGCGCRAFSIDREQRVAPGDRCPIPPGVRPFVDARLDEAFLRSRLRLRWPGECACPMRPFATDARVAACPVGDDAERLDPVETALARDGSVILVSRSLAVELAPDGTRYETPIDPALNDVLGVIALPRGGALILSNTFGSSVRVQARYIPRRGAGPVRPTDLLEDDFESLRAYAPPAGDEVWLYGTRAAEGGLALLRCRFEDEPEASRCTEIRPSRSAECPQNTGAVVYAVAALEGGDLAVAIDHSIGFVHGDELVCVPGTHRPEWRSLSGGTVDELRVWTMVATGRRLMTCGNATFDGRRITLVSHATVGPLDSPTPITWRPAAQDDDAYCPPTRFVDPRDPTRAVLRIVGADLRLSQSSTVVERFELDTEYYRELGGGFTQVATTSSAIAVTTLYGETWGARRDEPTLRKIHSFRRPRAERTARAILPVEGGFRVYTGGASPITVRTGARCEDVRVEARPDAYAAETEHYDRAVTRLGDWSLLFAQRGQRFVMFVRDASDAPVTEVPIELDVRRAVEVIPGRWAALLTEDGALHATDGQQLVPLDAGPGWHELDASGGVGWAATDGELARIVAGPGGDLRLERDVLAAADTTELSALPRERPPQFAALRALCDGRVLIVYSEALERTIAAAQSTASAWVLEPVDGRPSLRRYTTFEASDARPLGLQAAEWIGGPDDAPVIVFSRTPLGDGLHVPGRGSSALPFLDTAALATRGSELLAGSRYLRLHYLRVER